MRTHILLTAALLVSGAAAPPVSAQDSVPSGRAFALAAFDASRNRLVMWGGAVLPSHAMDETWEWDGRRWTRLRPANSPPARALGAMTYDPVRRRVVLFGGLDSTNQVLGDTWEWDGRNWTRRADGPPPRAGHVLVFVPLRNRVVLTGGFDGEEAVDDHWEWDGSAWTRVRGPDVAARARSLETTRLRAYRAAMRSDLRNLVTAQESFFADYLRYTASLDSAAFHASTGVTVTLMSVSPMGWAAVAVHSSAPGARCGIFVGSAAPPFPEVRNEGEPACTGFPPDVER